MNISNIKQLIYNGIIKNYWLYPSKQIRLLVKKGFKQSLKGEKSINVIENYPIDLVVTWVDESDLNWQSEKRKYEADIKKEIDTDNLVERYRDWNILRFWFRSVEKYAPWIRKVFFVTYGHLPEWINLNNEKLVVVKHEDFIPQEYLPTFSCRPIELNLWRIKDLSEHFIYLNDDVLFCSFVKKEDFFWQGRPKMSAVCRPLQPYKGMTTHLFALYNNLAAINFRYKIRNVMDEHPEKWFSYKYGRNLRFNYFSYENNYLSGVFDSHLCFLFNKSSMVKCAEEYLSLFNQTCMNKFRTKEDITIQIFKLWDMMHNNFEPVPLNYFGEHFQISDESLKIIKNEINSKKNKVICLNDSPQIHKETFEKYKYLLNEILLDKFPEKSSFEK